MSRYDRTYLAVVGVAIAAIAVVIAVVIGVGFGVGFVPAAPVPGQEYQVMLYTCVSDNDGTSMVDVHFVGPDRGKVGPQLVPSALVFKDEEVPPGSGYFYAVDYGVVDGRDFGERLEFRFNGELQPLSVERECPSR